MCVLRASILSPSTSSSYLCFSPSSSSSCSSTAQMSWDSVCLVIPEKDRGSEVTGGGLEDEDFGVYADQMSGLS